MASGVMDSILYTRARPGGELTGSMNTVVVLLGEEQANIPETLDVVISVLLMIHRGRRSVRSLFECEQIEWKNK